MNMGRGFFFNQTQKRLKWIISNVIQSKLQLREITACYRPSPAVVNWLLLQQNVGYPRISNYSVMNIFNFVTFFSQVQICYKWCNL